jgi:hypothetical protein
MIKLRKNNSSTKDSSSNKPEPEISGPVEFKIEQWFTLKAWKNATVRFYHNRVENRKIIIYKKCFSFSDKLHLDMSFDLFRGKREYKIWEYCTELTGHSLGDASRGQQVFWRDRSALLQFVDPSQYEYWLNYKSGLISWEEREKGNT